MVTDKKEYPGMNVKTVEEVKELIINNLPIEDKFLLTDEDLALIDKVSKIWLECVEEARAKEKI